MNIQELTDGQTGRLGSLKFEEGLGQLAI